MTVLRRRLEGFLGAARPPTLPLPLTLIPTLALDAVEPCPYIAHTSSASESTGMIMLEMPVPNVVERVVVRIAAAKVSSACRQRLVVMAKLPRREHLRRCRNLILTLTLTLTILTLWTLTLTLTQLFEFCILTVS